ncbi:LOW QUALITY PROTEIN: MP domain-containing protein, partial [Cephalotus follicularis]
KNFKYIYFALVQITIKPLTRGLNSFVLTCLRDARHLNFDDSLIGAIETSLCNGLVYFNRYPDLTISLTDKNILETLKINIKLHGYNMLLGYEIIAIIHHVPYKATNLICHKSLVNLTKEHTDRIYNNQSMADTQWWCMKHPINQSISYRACDRVNTMSIELAGTGHVIGDPTYLKDRTSDQLSNLRCRKLQDFRWYKIFMTKVLTREDANQPYLREKFITGLPTLFAEKIKSKYREKHKGVVPYETLTYRDIVSTITKTGLEICNDIKMSKQIKRESKTYKKELEDFCTQFGYETFK